MALTTVKTCGNSAAAHQRALGALQLGHAAAGGCRSGCLHHLQHVTERAGFLKQFLIGSEQLFSHQASNLLDNKQASIQLQQVTETSALPLHALLLA